jgi:hypothetical protein
MIESICPGCGLLGPKEDGSIHPYMLAFPRCWRLFNAIMAREYATPELMPTHYLSVDAYAVQHPGDPDDRRARQSVWIHLAGLHAVLRDKREPEYRYGLMRRLAKEVRDFGPPPPHELFRIVAGSIGDELPPEEHRRSVRAWAKSALEDYLAATPSLPALLDAYR